MIAAVGTTELAILIIAGFTLSSVLLGMVTIIVYLSRSK